MFKQIELAYDFNTLEPYIDELTMQTHYAKHHAAYTNNLNAAVEKSPELSGKTIEELLSNVGNITDPGLHMALRNNGGGFYNHNLYFSILSPSGSKEPEGELKNQIIESFGSVENLKDKLSAAAISQFGSGWAWLSTDKAGKLQISSTANQDNPLMKDGLLTPILGIDVWEHAYYLKYKNLRADYIKAFWEVLDWDQVNKRYEVARV
ncbi:superoxide dismutase [Cellulosilyticum sp. I15G10I2]|uniref:superoxide dismutase n=1 Tax=Cellulosilyticum sp. I15G10I2 TaxID=1892843 RepID=UPI00085C6E8D|nr:superoxide dismutase [Cellulosilyticum sp. I15G10I2]